MQRSLKLLDKFADSVVVDALPDTERPRLHFELRHPLPAAEVQRHPQQVVDQNLERFAGPAGFSLYSRGDIVVERQRSAHILML